MRTALIVGAGIGGLAAGLALQRAGWHVRLFERAAAARELGFGLGLAPYAIRALHDLGVAEQVLAQAGTAESLSSLTGGWLTMEARRPNGRILRRITVHRDRVAGMTLPAIVMRPVLHTALLRALGDETVSTNSEAVAFELEGDRVRLRFADGGSVGGDVLIGADGVSSVIRRQLHPAEAPPRPSGYVAFRGASPEVALLGGRQFIAYLGRGIEGAIVQVSDTMIYWYLSLLSADVARGSLEPSALLRRITIGFDPLFQSVAAAAIDLRLDELLVRDPLRQWGTGPVTLVGDAAHPMLPHTGQGAAQALADATALGRALAAAGNHLGALREYERQRLPRANRVARSGPRIARVTTTHNPVVDWLRTGAILLLPSQMLVSAFSSRRDARRARLTAAQDR